MPRIVGSHNVLWPPSWASNEISVMRLALGCSGRGRRGRTGHGGGRVRREVRRAVEAVALVADDLFDHLLGQHLGEAGHAAGSDAAVAVLLERFRTLLHEHQLRVEPDRALHLSGSEPAGG